MSVTAWQVQASASVQTELGERYLVQLCKHFAHKVEVSYSETHGECGFSCGTAVLDADAEGLQIVATAPDDIQLAETKSVIERHLIRFALKENLQSLDWTIAGPAVSAPLASGSGDQ